MTDFYFSTLASTPNAVTSAVWLDNWVLITAIGEESKSYLQGQLTCDVVSLEPNQIMLGAHCDAKGKVWSIFRLFAIDGGYALLLPKAGSEKALFELKKYSVFSKVEIELSSLSLVGIIGEQSTTMRQATEVSSITIDEQRSIAFGERAALEQALEQSSLTVADEALWQLMDINAGMPRVDNNNQNQHIPQALNLQLLDGISFEKGCYTGQETVARAKYRGMNKRAMFKVGGPLADAPTLPITLERAVGDNWRSAGDLIECVVQDGQAVGTIILAKDTEHDAKLRVAESGEIWQVLPLPYSFEEQE